MSEIIYQLTHRANKACNSCFTWLTVKDLDKFNRHQALCDQRILTQNEWNEIYKQKTIYCLLFADDYPVGRGAVEKYSDTAWEAADIRVAKYYRNRGFGKEILYFLSDYILEHGKIATCRTEDYNFPMKSVIASVGYTRLL